MTWVKGDLITWKLGSPQISLIAFNYEGRSLLYPNGVNLPLLEIGLLWDGTKIYVTPADLEICPSADGAATAACGMADSPTLKQLVARFSKCNVISIQDTPVGLPNQANEEAVLAWNSAWRNDTLWRQGAQSSENSENRSGDCSGVHSEMSGQAYRSPTDSMVKQACRVAGEIDVILSQDGTFRWRLKVTNNTPYHICEILYPRLGPLAVSEKVELLYPHHAGEKIVNVPAALASSKYREFWRAESRETSYGYCREINYCGLASMSWMDLHNESLSFYVASYDPDFPVTGLRIETGGPNNPWVSLSFRKYVYVAPGGSMECADVVWKLHTGTWHEAAEEYRRWFDQHVEQCPEPEDLQSEVVLSPHYSFRRYEGITHRFPDIPALVDRDQDEFGSRHMFIAAWNHMGFDSHYPNYNPDLELGTPWELAKGVRYREKRGGFTTFYINSRIMDIHSEYRPTLGEAWMLRNEKLDPIYETYGPAETLVLCPSHPQWRKCLADFAAWMCQAYGARGIYYDQLGSATPYPCYATHEHDTKSPTSGFNQGYIDLLERTRRRLGEIRKDAFLMIENCGDIYSSRVWGSLVWNGPDYDEYFNLYKFTFPEHVLVCMVHPKALSDPKKQEETFLSDLARAVVLGAVLWADGYDFDVRVSDDEVRGRMLAVMREALEFRRIIASDLAQSRYRDTLGIEVSPGICASRWERGDGGLVIVANPKRSKDCYLTLKWSESCKTENHSGPGACHIGSQSPAKLSLMTSERCTWEEMQVGQHGAQYTIQLSDALFTAVRWYLREDGER